MKISTKPNGALICRRCLQLIQPAFTQRLISTSAVLCRNEKWRNRNDIARSNEYGPLTDLRDWSYLDGRETPLRVGQVRRMEDQREIAKRIDLLAAEMQKAIDDHKNSILSEEDQKIEVQAKKLKKKGSKYKKQQRLLKVLP